MIFVVKVGSIFMVGRLLKIDFIFFFNQNYFTF